MIRVSLAFMVALTMARCDTMNVFPDVNGNLTKVTWAHAVNSKVLLEEAFASDVMMLEADVGIGKIEGKEMGDIPIMCHPPNKTSDISLEWFISNVTKRNENDTVKVKKGIKLDFKSIDAFEKSIEIIKKVYNKVSYPIWINADIISGPVNANATPVDSERFLAKSKDFPNSTLSIGWTTEYNNKLLNSSYEEKDIQNMLDAIQKNDIVQNITFPVRAALAANSLPQMKRLVDTVHNSTLTIWSGANDTVNIDKLKDLIVDIGLDKTYLDLPWEMYSKLHLPSSGNMAHLGKVAVFISVVALFLGMKIFK